jgi:hypothetical protein
MWRPFFAFFTLNLLLTTAASGAESRASLKVGITITGQPRAAATSPAVALPRMRPAMAGHRTAESLAATGRQKNQ